MLFERNSCSSFPAIKNQIFFLSHPVHNSIQCKIQSQTLRKTFLNVLKTMPFINNTLTLKYKDF